MPRYILQSADTFEFMVSQRNGDVGFTPSLLTALRHGIVTDPERVAEMRDEYFDAGACIVIDLDERK
jgi:hypothetical protein